MSATATVQFRLEPQTKAAAEAVFKNMGLTMSAAYNLFIQQTLLRGALPFQVISAPPLNEETIQSLRDTRAGKNLSRAYDSPAEMWSDILAED